jgi:hypothetical protein
MSDSSDQQDTQRTDAEAELQREIRRGRKFTLAEAIGRLAGPGAMKGASPIARLQQAEVEIEYWLKRHLRDAEGALHTVLLRAVKESDLLLNNHEQPLIVLAACCQRVLDSEYRLRELVRSADAEWGRVYRERPYFDTEGAAPHPSDPYTVDSVRRDLDGLLEQLAAAAG